MAITHIVAALIIEPLRCFFLIQMKLESLVFVKKQLLLMLASLMLNNLRTL